jgi:hypothetical protein
MPLSSSLAEADVLMIHIPHLPDGRIALDANLP